MASISRNQNAKPKKAAAEAGKRQGERKHSGAKPSGTNLSRGGGSAAKKNTASGSGARGKRARSS